jgi:hypothetical protein
LLLGTYSSFTNNHSINIIMIANGIDIILNAFKASISCVPFFMRESPLTYDCLDTITPPIVAAGNSWILFSVGVVLGWTLGLKETDGSWLGPTLGIDDGIEETDGSWLGHELGLVEGADDKDGWWLGMEVVEGEWLVEGTVVGLELGFVVIWIPPPQMQHACFADLSSKRPKTSNALHDKGLVTELQSKVKSPFWSFHPGSSWQIKLGASDGKIDSEGIVLGVSNGREDGVKLGWLDGWSLVWSLGISLKVADGDVLGNTDGDNVGSMLGVKLGILLGVLLGMLLGILLGLILGSWLGLELGTLLGNLLGLRLGILEGCILGLDVGSMLGRDEGPLEGLVLGLVDLLGESEGSPDGSTRIWFPPPQIQQASNSVLPLSWPR